MDVAAFPWVSNPSKALRAAKELKTKGSEVTEEAVKELYIKYGGLVLEENASEEVIEEKPVKKSKKSE